MHLSELVLINFWSLNDFDLSDFNVLNWINVRNFFGNFFLNNFRSEKLKDFSSIGFSDFLSNDLVHFSSDWLLLWRLSIIGFALLVGWFSGKGNSEYSQNVSILRFTVLNGFNECFSFFDQRAEFISGHVNAVERCDGLSSLSLINNKFDFSPVESILVGSKIWLIGRYNSSFDTIFDFFETLGSVGTGEAKWFWLERSRCFELEPLLSRKWINNFLFHAFLTEVFFIFSLSHWWL